MEGRTTTLDKTTTVHPVESNPAAHVETTVLEMIVATKTTVATKIIVQIVIEPRVRLNERISVHQLDVFSPDLNREESGCTNDCM